MVAFVLLVVLFVHGFWIWLILAVLLALLAWRASAGRRWVLIGFAAASGLVGGIGGCVAIGTTRSQASFDDAAARYFAQACAARAGVRLPDPPLEPQAAVRWIQDRSDVQPILKRVELSSLSGRESGRYFAVETVGDAPQQFDTTIQGEHQAPIRPSARQPEPLPKGLVRYSIRNRSVTTEEDARHFVQAYETVVTDVRSDEVVARRVVLGRSVRRATVVPPYVCPGPDVPASGCDAEGCEMAPFLLAAVPPAVAASR